MSVKLQAEIAALGRQLEEQRKTIEMLARRVALLEDPGLGAVHLPFPAVLAESGYTKPETTARPSGPNEDA